jgi:chromosome segregation ATPase
VDNLLLIGPRALTRTADEIAALTRAVGRVPDLLERLDARAGEIEAALTRALKVGRSLDRRGAAAIEALDGLQARVDRAEAQLERAIERAELLEARAGELDALGGRVEALVTEVMAQAQAMALLGESIAAQAGALTRQAETIGASLPTLTKAVEMAEPLEGAVDRVAWIVDRLPGGRPRP